MIIVRMKERIKLFFVNKNYNKILFNTVWINKVSFISSCQFENQSRHAKLTKILLTIIIIKY